MIKELPLTITPKALSMIKSIMKKKQVPDSYGLRIGTQNTNSCGASSFMLGFDTKKTSDDAFEIDGINVYINKRDLLYVVNLKLDFEENQEVSGFKFDN